MARIAGVDLPRDKRIEIALTYIYGIGRSLARRIVEESGVDPSVRVHALSIEDENKIRSVIEKNCTVEGELRSQTTRNIQRLMEIGSYRGLRHRLGLPTRGQRTHTNARTRRGPRRTVGVRRKAAAV
jgi:small subunit ribosomal protein S13